jgi:actin-related protein 8
MPDREDDWEEDAEQEDNSGGLTGQDALGSKVIVIHLGSQNLRIGLGSDALPKTVPMVIAWKSDQNESEQNGGEPKPKRLRVDEQDGGEPRAKKSKVDDGAITEPEKMFGEEVR